MKISSIKATLPNKSKGRALAAPQELTITVLEPESGMWLTQSGEIEDMHRTFSDKVYLGQGRTEADWVEWTTEQKEKHIELQNSIREEEEKKMLLERKASIKSNILD